MSESDSRVQFDFNQSMGQTFLTDGGRPFGIRLWFWLAACYTVVCLISFPMLAEYYPAILDFNWQNVKAAQSGEILSDEDSLEMLRLVGKMVPGYLILMIGMWVSIAVSETALHRRLFLGAEYPKVPIRLGKTELGVMLVQFGVCVLITLIYFMSVLVFAIVSVLMGFLSKALLAIVLIFGILCLIGVIIYSMVRLAPAAAMTVSRDKLTVFGARPVAKGRFWSLFIAYLVAGLGGYVAIYTVMGIASVLLIGNADAMIAISGLGSEPPSVVFNAMGDKMSNPIFVLIAVLCIVVYCAVYALMSLTLSGIAAYALKLYYQDNPSTE